MNFIITADIHLKIKPDIPEQWQLDRYGQLSETLIELCNEHNADLIIAGDIFHDHKITSKEMMLFSELCIGVVESRHNLFLIDGNHDYSDPRNTTLDHFWPLYELLNSTLGSSVSYRLDRFKTTHPEVPGSDLVLTFKGHSELNHPTIPAAARKNVLISHFRSNLNEFVKEEIDVKEFTKGFDMCFVGDIHAEYQPLPNVVYVNSPLNNTFETNPKHSCVLFSYENGEIEWSRIPLELPNLIQINTTAKDFADHPIDDFNYYRVVVTGTPEELRKIETKCKNVKVQKIPEVADVYTYSEDKEEVTDSIEEELVGYMQELGMTSKQIADMMEIFYVTPIS